MLPSKRSSRPITGSDGPDLLSRQLAPPVLLASRLSFLPNLVVDIVSVGPQFKMIRVDAGWVIAIVPHDVSHRITTIEEYRDAVCSPFLPA